MSRPAFDTMSFRIAEFLASPGRRLPVASTLQGKHDPETLCMVESIELDGEGFAQLSTMYFEVTLRARLVQPCRRCLAPVESTLEIDESFEVQVPPGSESIDLLPIVLRLVLSSREPNVLCKPDCLGLCPACGINLNRHPDHKCELDRAEKRTLRDFLA